MSLTETTKDTTPIVIKSRSIINNTSEIGNTYPKPIYVVVLEDVYATPLTKTNVQPKKDKGAYQLLDEENELEIKIRYNTAIKIGANNFFIGPKDTVATTNNDPNGVITVPADTTYLRRAGGGLKKRTHIEQEFVLEEGTKMSLKKGTILHYGGLECELTCDRRWCYYYSHPYRFTRPN